MRDEISQIETRHNKIEEQLQKQKTPSKLEQTATDLLGDVKKAKAKAEDALEKLNHSGRVELCTEKYKKDFEKQFFINLSKTLKSDPVLGDIISCEASRGSSINARWEALHQELASATPKTEENAFILGAEAREFLNIYLGALHEVFENKPFIKGVCEENKRTRPFLTALIGEYMERDQVLGVDEWHRSCPVLDQEGGGLIYRNKGNLYSNTQPSEWK